MPPARSAAAKSFSNLVLTKDAESDRAAKPPPECRFTRLNPLLFILSAVEESLIFNRER